jgi:hypothetical protein
VTAGGRDGGVPGAVQGELGGAPFLHSSSSGGDLLAANSGPTAVAPASGDPGRQRVWVSTGRGRGTEEIREVEAGMTGASSSLPVTLAVTMGW